MSQLPLLPLDTANFAALRRNGQVYVDKTAYIQRMLLEERMQYVFLARPRRFGKSLLVSTLAHLFSREDDTLFQDLDIARAKRLQDVPRVPVLILNMARVAGNSPAAVRSELTRLVHRISRRFDFEPTTQAPPWGALDDLFDHLQSRYGQFAVLVDEYDAPLMRLLAHAPAAPDDEQETLSDLRDFYRTLKNWDDAVQFAFLTGILRVGGSGLLSALNNVRNLSDLASWSGLCGFTEDEIDRYLTPHLRVAARNCNQSPAALRSALRRHYNGYRFAATGAPVYNPISYLTALSQCLQAEDAREIQATDWPYPWLDLGQTQFLFQYMKEQGQTLRDLDFNASGARSMFDLSRPSLNALLYQTGFLTLLRDPEDGLVGLDFPNWEVRSALAEGMHHAYFGRRIGKGSPEWDLVRDMAAALENRDCVRALDAFDRILDRVSYVELEAESHYQIALHLVCTVCQSILRVDAEVLRCKGRAYIVVETRDTFYVFELKLNQSVTAALAQIRDRGYLAKYDAEGKRVVGIGLNFIQPSGPGPRAGAEDAQRRYAWDALPGAGTQLTARERPAPRKTQADEAASSAPKALDR